jgi:hypothetical protein
VTAAAPGYAAGTTVVRYAFPWSFLLATLLGGLVGGGLHYLRSRGSASQGLARQITGGILMALLVGVASTVGVNFLPVTFSARYGEALFFTIAAIAAYLWETIEIGG